MTTSWRSAAVRLGAFLAVCILGVFALYAVFGQLRFGHKSNSYNAVFANVTGLEKGDFVRIAGVEVGSVDDISIQDDTSALVKFTADDSVVLTEGNKAVIRYDDLIGGRRESQAIGLHHERPWRRRRPAVPPSHREGSSPRAHARSSSPTFVVESQLGSCRSRADRPEDSVPG